MPDIAPSTFYEQFKDEKLNIVPDPVKASDKALVLPPAPKKEAAPDDGSRRSLSGVEGGAEDQSGDDFDPVKGFMGDDEGNAITALESNEFAELLTDSVGLLKDGISEAFRGRFEKALKEGFPEEKRDMLNVVIACDQEGGLSVDKLKGLAAKLELDFMKVLEVKVKYIQIKERWQASEYKDYQKKGIKRNAKRVAEKYFANSAPDPLTMLIAYVAVALGGDALRIGTNIIKERKEATNGTA